MMNKPTITHKSAAGMGSRDDWELQGDASFRPGTVPSKVHLRLRVCPGPREHGAQALMTASEARAVARDLLQLAAIADAHDSPTTPEEWAAMGARALEEGGLQYWIYAMSASLLEKGDWHDEDFVRVLDGIRKAGGVPGRLAELCLRMREQLLETIPTH